MWSKAAGSLSDTSEKDSSSRRKAGKETEVDYTKLSMKERAELLPPPTDDTMKKD